MGTNETEVNAARTIAQDGLRWAVTLTLGLASCGHAKLVDDGATVTIPAGGFVMGSSGVERANATELSVRAGTYGRHSVRALEAELAPHTVEVATFAIMTRPVTQAEYQIYVFNTGSPEPYVDPHVWAQMETGYDYAEVERTLWAHGAPKPEHARHPTVLVTREEAGEYCKWWGHNRNGHGSLPTEAQWEKAARGSDGRVFPWGNHFVPGLVNSAEAGIGRSVAAGSRDATASPYGVLDMAGNVFEWTRTRFMPSGWVVKGGGFNADAAASRAAARHGRPGEQRHPAIGFRCAVIPYT